MRYIRYICTDPELGIYYNPDNSTARRYPDFLIECDDVAVRKAVLKPLEIWGAYEPRRTS